MNSLTIEVSPTTAGVFGSGEDAGRLILVAAVVKWYELGKVSQGKAAEVLGVSRAEFLDLLAKFQVTAWQYSEGDLEEEMALA